MIIQIQELFTNMNMASTYTIVICQNRTYCKPYRKVSHEWCASFIWRIMQNSPHEVFQYVVLGYNRLKKNRVTRGLPTSFQSFSLLKVKRDLDRVRNKIMFDGKSIVRFSKHWYCWYKIWNHHKYQMLVYLTYEVQLWYLILPSRL